MLDYLVRDRRRLRRGTRAFVREVEVGEACVFVDHGFQWDGSANVWLTRARASFVVQAGPVFDVRPRSALARVLGYQGGVACGDPCFDYFFAVRTPSPEETWDALTTRARSLLASEFADARLVSDGRFVTLWREGDFGREVDASAAIEIVNELVSYQSDALEVARRLPGAAYRPACGPWHAREAPSVELATPVPVRIAPVAHHGEAVTAAQAACGRAAHRFAFDLDDASSPRTGRLVDAGREVGASALTCDGSHIALRWPGLCVSRDALLAGAQLVGGLASGQLGGLYR
jgi:hypothetical protein